MEGETNNSHHYQSWAARVTTSVAPDTAASPQVPDEKEATATTAADLVQKVQKCDISSSGITVELSPELATESKPDHDDDAVRVGSVTDDIDGIQKEQEQQPPAAEGPRMAESGEIENETTPSMMMEPTSTDSLFPPENSTDAEIPQALDTTSTLQSSSPVVDSKDDDGTGVKDEEKPVSPETSNPIGIATALPMVEEDNLHPSQSITEDDVPKGADLISDEAMDVPMASDDHSEEHEIDFGGGNEPDLDALLSSTNELQQYDNDDDDGNRDIDDMLDELLDDHHNAAQELDNLMQEQSTSDGVPHLGDVDEASKVVSPSSEPDAEQLTDHARESPNIIGAASEISSSSNTQKTSRPQFNPKVVASPPRTVPGDLVSFQQLSNSDPPGPLHRVVGRPNLSARMTGTRRYTPPKKHKTPLKVVIPPPTPHDRSPPSSARNSTTPKLVTPKAVSPKAVSPVKKSLKMASPSKSVTRNTAGTPSTTTSSPGKVPTPTNPTPLKKRSLLQTFTRALSGSSSTIPRKVASPPSETGASGVVRKLQPIDPHSRLLKETSASIAQRRDRFIPPPATFPTISEVIRAIHSGAFDRRASKNRSSSSPRSQSSSYSRSPRSTWQ